MFESYRRELAGARFGILGSGPTLNDFENDIGELCDVVIACNGSVMALNPDSTNLDFFLYGDVASPTRSWFRESAKFQNKRGEVVVRILPNQLLPYDDLVLDSIEQRTLLEYELRSFLDYHQDDTKAYRKFIPAGHIVLKNGISFNYDGSTINEIDIDNFIFGRGTITGTGAQIATRMGASHINLFGCGFNNTASSGVYAYDNKGEPGGTNDDHTLCMDEILRQIQAKGIGVTSYGETKLTVESVSYHSNTI